MTEKACAVDGCARTVKARGYCKGHHRRWLKDGEPGKVFTPRPPGGFTHGTNNAYNAHKCRCEECREFKRTKDRQQRARRKAAAAADASKVPHGTPAGYAKWSCRCEPCTDANSEYMKAWYEENPEKRAEYPRRWRRSHAPSIRDVARNHGNQWTGAELEIVVMRTDLSLIELANLLGRTRYAVESARHRARTDPKWVAVAGVGTAGHAE